MPELYPEIEPYQSGRLKVSDIHELYYEQCGNPDGKPVLYLHGGPGGSVSGHYRRYFNPQKYRQIRMHQRGAGLSTPHAELKENTTQDLVADIEKLREHLGIKKWMVYGGSWGSTLALAYAHQFPQCVTEMILWGIFLGSDEETAWMYQKGANAIFPDAWEEYAAIIDPADRHNMLAAYYKKLTGSDSAERLRAAKAFSLWEARLLLLNPDPSILESLVNEFSADEFAIAIARLECHYFINHCFLKPDQLLEGIQKIKHIPAAIVHGRYDMVCPLESAWKLHKAWPESKLVIVPAAGHSGRELAMQNAIIDATNSFVDRVVVPR